MVFKTDGNLPVEAAERLVAAGHDAQTVFQQRLNGDRDENVAAVCCREGRVLITLDRDFGDIRAYPPHQYPGFIVLRLARLDKHRVLAVIDRVSLLLSRQPLDGKLWVVDETQVRVRS